MNKMKYSFVLLFCLFVSQFASAQESKFKALFLYKFAEYIEWPSNPGKIVVGVAGNTDVYDHLSTFAASRGTIEVVKLQSSAGYNKCNIVYLSSASDGQFDEYKTKIANGSILLVTENMSLVSKGSDIGFFLEAGRLRFIINKESIESKSMVPSTKLLALGKSI